jgi:hypothetical protein
MVDRRLHVLVEGQTEELIVRDVIEPHLSGMGWLVSTSIVATKRPAGGPAHRGGVASWAKLNREITRLLNDSGLAVLTTVIDYYAFPDDAPGMATRPAGDPFHKVCHVEQQLAAAIGDHRFLPHLTLHEVEAWVFAAATELGDLYGNAALTDRLRADVRAAGGPELVNDGPKTAPSKRLMRYRPGYVKTMDGPLAIADLGLPVLRRSCPHLDAWLDKLDQSRGT